MAGGAGIRMTRRFDFTYGHKHASGELAPPTARFVHLIGAENAQLLIS
jgi:hypothetical protein